MKSRIWGAEVGIGGLVWVTLMIAGRSRMLRDPGTLWHVIVGRRIIDGGRFLDVDPFSFTFGGRPWIAQQWLGECVMSVVHDLAGFDGLLLTTVTGLAVLHGWMAHRLLRGGLAWPATASLVMIGVAAGANHLHVRPHVATMFGLGLTFAWLGDVEAGRLRLGQLWWRLVPLCAIWSNAHGGVAGGLASLGLVVAGWCLSRLAGRDSPVMTMKQGAGAVLLVLACSLTILANPYGWRLPGVWVSIIGSPVLPRLIIEHAPPRLVGPDFALLVGLGLLYGVVLLGTPMRAWRATWLLPLLWFGLAMTKVREAPLFALATLAALADVLPHSRAAGWLARPGRDLFHPAPLGARRPSGRTWVVPAAVVAVGLGLQVAGVSLPILGRGWARLDPDHWPVELIPELRRIGSGPGGRNVFNDILFGGFLIHYAPGARVFMDDRCELYGDEWLEKSDRLERDPEGLRRWLSEYRVDYALVRPGSGYDLAFEGRAGWSVVGRARSATLYRRDRDSPPVDGEGASPGLQSARATPP